MTPIDAKISNFDHKTGLFNLLIKVNINGKDASYSIARSYKDFQRINRQSSYFEGIPTNSYKKLARIHSWALNGEGWDFTLKRSLTNVERWLNATLSTFDEVDLLKILDEASYRTELQSAIERKEQETIPRMLQQYFASDANIALVLKHALNNINDFELTTFIEPSCGDGRIMLQLLERGAENVIGVDIDSKVGNVASIKCSSEQYKERNVKIHITDFLATNRNILLPQKIQNIEINGKNECSQLVDVEQYGRDLRDTNIIVVGGPPFTIVPHNIGKNIIDLLNGSENETVSSNDLKDCKFDYSNYDRADYPILFLIHSALVLKASKIVFILPYRCSQPSFIERATCALNQSQQQRESNSNSVITGDNPESTTSPTKIARICTNNENSACCSKRSTVYTWQLITNEIADNTFTMLGRPIKQPAVIQVWQYL